MFDKHADEAIEAEIWLKAEVKGENKNVLKMKLQKLLATRKLPSIFVR